MESESNTATALATDVPRVVRAYFEAQTVERDLMSLATEGVFATIIASDMSLRNPHREPDSRNSEPG